MVSLQGIHGVIRNNWPGQGYAILVKCELFIHLAEGFMLNTSIWDSSAAWEVLENEMTQNKT